MYLIKDFEIFLIVYLVVVLDTIFGISESVKKKIKFSWDRFEGVFWKIVKYSVFLLLGNLIEHFAEISGYKIEGVGLKLIAFYIIFRESASIRKSIIEMSNKPEV